MIALYGGDEAFVKKLDALFTADSTIQTGIPDISGLIGQYSQGDEQCHHVAYLYDYAGAPYKTQERVRQVMATLYNDTPAGQCGNVDCGQMAAWYVFSALGFYPVNPASGVYAIGSPVVEQSGSCNLDAKKYKGRKFTMIAEHNSPQNIYIQSASLNGKPFDQPWITHEQITAGGTLKLVMGPKPNPEWGRAQSPPAGHDAGWVPIPGAARGFSTSRWRSLAHPRRLRGRGSCGGLCPRPQHGPGRSESSRRRD